MKNQSGFKVNVLVNFLNQLIKLTKRKYGMHFSL